MMENLIQSYYDFFDKKIWDSTIVVAFIGIMIFLAWFLAHNNWFNYKTNILEYENNQNYDSIVSIDGKKYKIVFQEIK